MPSVMPKILLVAHSLLLVCCGSRTSGDQEPEVDIEIPDTFIVRQENATREMGQSLYQAVGEVFNGTNGYCSGLLVAPGIFLTARHCFPEQAMIKLDRVTLKFSQNGIMNRKAQQVTGQGIEDVILDEGDIDLAFVLFDRLMLDLIVPMDSLVFATAPAPPDAPLHIVGFPGSSDGIRKRIVSHSCKTTEQSGRIGPLPKDPGYGGLLYGTNCLAWFGNSGGPVFQVDDEEKAVLLLGVVSHTFDITAEGDIDSSKVTKDSYGSRVSSVNYSSIASSITWNTLQDHSRRNAVFRPGVDTSESVWTHSR